jgi:ABC-type methionine transport system ATPase subunit
MYYVIHKLQLMLRVVIHLNTHEHPVAKGMCKDVSEEIKVLVKGQVFHMPKGKISTIVLNPSRAFLAHHLFNEDGERLMETLQGEKLDKVINKF